MHRWDWQSGGCVCGSEWNHLENGCSFEYPIIVRAIELDRYAPDDDYPDFGFYECGHGHAFCGRH